MISPLSLARSGLVKLPLILLPLFVKHDELYIRFSVICVAFLEVL